MPCAEVVDDHEREREREKRERERRREPRSRRTRVKRKRDMGERKRNKHSRMLELVRFSYVKSGCRTRAWFACSWRVSSTSMQTGALIRGAARIERPKRRIGKQQARATTQATLFSIMYTCTVLLLRVRI